eukprot:gb/GECH01008499.1/.p1 GENE.gb/GECH01008499.1/~~gb/GECH01008499.1/.p1  ORF type:complete len:951 (+),score=247.55 gb/GECH01008499.1/:1-2853(+)
MTYKKKKEFTFKKSLTSKQNTSRNNNQVYSHNSHEVTKNNDSQVHEERVQNFMKQYENFFTTNQKLHSNNNHEHESMSFKENGDNSKEELDFNHQEKDFDDFENFQDEIDSDENNHMNENRVESGHNMNIDHAPQRIVDQNIDDLLNDDKLLNEFQSSHLKTLSQYKEVPNKNNNSMKHMEIDSKNSIKSKKNQKNSNTHKNRPSPSFLKIDRSGKSPQKYYKNNSNSPSTNLHYTSSSSAPPPWHYTVNYEPLERHSYQPNFSSVVGREPLHSHSNKNSKTTLRDDTHSKSSDSTSSPRNKIPFSDSRRSAHRGSDERQVNRRISSSPVKDFDRFVHRMRNSKSPSIPSKFLSFTEGFNSSVSNNNVSNGNTGSVPQESYFFRATSRETKPINHQNDRYYDHHGNHAKEKSMNDSLKIKSPPDSPSDVGPGSYNTATENTDRILRPRRTTPVPFSSTTGRNEHHMNYRSPPPDPDDKQNVLSNRNIKSEPKPKQSEKKHSGWEKLHPSSPSIPSFGSLVSREKRAAIAENRPVIQRKEDEIFDYSNSDVVSDEENKVNSNRTDQPSKHSKSPREQAPKQRGSRPESKTPTYVNIGQSTSRENHYSLFTPKEFKSSFKNDEKIQIDRSFASNINIADNNDKHKDFKNNNKSMKYSNNNFDVLLKLRHSRSPSPVNMNKQTRRNQYRSRSQNPNQYHSLEYDVNWEALRPRSPSPPQLSKQPGRDSSSASSKRSHHPPSRPSSAFSNRSRPTSPSRLSNQKQRPASSMSGKYSKQKTDAYQHQDFYDYDVSKFKQRRPQSVVSFDKTTSREQHRPPSHLSSPIIMNSVSEKNSFNQSEKYPNNKSESNDKHSENPQKYQRQSRQKSPRRKRLDPQISGDPFMKHQVGRDQLDRLENKHRTHVDRFYDYDVNKIQSRSALGNSTFPKNRVGSKFTGRFEDIAHMLEVSELRK